ncbi:PIN domain-like protein [Rhizopogon vinicolor AM-OR11-026]|uniref:PIN domain-like protein n=1 Tax=Rhizopogon vinicolor AM-OR11-026 TaxID=1314800 RepID=A0A1B7MQZ2_9AGAM|nr:PIN domain-like protein [Rhizopogon vinicolor AM-OR11-026]
MGITDLWKLVSPTIHGQTLTAFALEGLWGHVQDEGGISMMTIGVDASSWLYVVCKLQAFQFGHARSGENPELWTLMYKLVALASAPIHAHFVFDGDDRPSIKCGKHVCSAPHWLTQHLQELLGIFGFTWSMAKGEAEADLAFLSKAGRIAAVLTEDSDAILFGAERVLCL